MEKYDQDIQNLEPSISFQHSLSLTTEETFDTLKIKLINQLESIIRSFSEQDIFLDFLNQINNYESLIEQNVSMPSQIETVADKILYIIAVSQICNKKEIADELRKVLEQISFKISNRLSQTIQTDVYLTLENSEDIKAIFNEIIDNMYEVIKKYYTIQLSLSGIGEDELAKNIHTFLEIIQTLSSEHQAEMIQVLDNLKQEVDINMCTNQDLKTIILFIRSKIQPKLEEASIYVGAVQEVKDEILQLLENPAIPESIKIEAREKLGTVLSNWKEKLKDKDSIQSDNSLYQNLEHETVIKLLFLKDLSNIKMSIELYLTNKKQYVKAIRK